MWYRKKSLGISKSGTLFLDELEKLLNIKIERESHISYYYYDGRIGNILIEVDGTYWHRTKKQLKRDIAKNKCAEVRGFTLYRFVVSRQREVKAALTKYAAIIEEIKNACTNIPDNGTDSTN